MNPTATTELAGMILRTPGIKQGSPHVAGTSVLVRTIASLHAEGLLPEEIAAEYGHLTLAQVHAALAYYFANRAAIEAEIAQQEILADRLAAEHRREACPA